MIHNIINKIKGWWYRMFDYSKIVKDFDLDMQTGEDMLNAIQKWSAIYNGHEPWIDEETISLHVAKTISEKVSEAVVVEYKSTCSEPYINKIYQRFLNKIQTNTEYMIGKSCIFFKPYFENGKISVNVIQADKFIPVKFTDDGELLAFITIDQITKGNKIYSRLEYNDLNGTTLTIKNIAYEGHVDGVVFERKINLSEVDKWKDIQEEQIIENVEHILGGFATMPTVNSIDNSSPLGQPIWHNAIETMKQIDKQFSRTVWEFEGSELAIDVDESLLDPNGKMPKGKKRLFRKLIFDETKDKCYNVFSPQIRDTSYFNGLNEFLRQTEVQCHLEHGTLCKADISPKTAQEIKQMKQSYYITVSNIQKVMQQALDDLVYGIYCLCKLYGISVMTNYTVEHDWDDSILVDKESSRNQALIERNNNITSDVQYVMDTKGYKEKEAIEFINKQKEYRKLTEEEKEKEEDLEE